MSQPVANEGHSVEELDFIYLVIHDVHGAARGRLLARRRMRGILSSGLGIYGGVCYNGIRGGITLHEDFGVKADFGNRYLKPILSTLRPSVQASSGSLRFGQVTCQLEFLDGKLDVSTPRTAAELQLERLGRELQLGIKSAFEMEFCIRKCESNQYYGHVNQWCSVSVLENCQDLLQDMIQELGKRQVPIDTIQTEYGPGQFEITLDVADGIKCPDSTIDFKNQVRTYLKSRGYEASFMTRIDPVLGASNAFHFNHSLWTLSGTNAFLDTSRAHCLSELGGHWLAGLLAHAPAITAFCCPTINCYRCIGQPWSPTYADWTCDGRLGAFRLKVEGENIYLENRLPTSASNPYLVLLATLAAGIDGVLRKLPLPEQKDHSVLLPTSLESALQALQADGILTEAVGHKLVEYFIYTKTTFELNEFRALGAADMSEPEQVELEREFYFHQA